MLVYYDITDVLIYARENSTLSGIQRTSLQILALLVGKNGGERVRTLAYDPALGKAFWYDSEYLFSRADKCSWEHLESDIEPKLYNYITKRYGRNWRTPLHHVRMRIANAATHGAYFKKRGLSVPLGSSQTGRRLVEFLPGDVVFSAGATWGLRRYHEFLFETRRTRGIKVVQFIHDLIPLLAPEHVVDRVPGQYAEWLEHLSNNVDDFLTNSQATKQDLDAWLAHKGALIRTRVLPLAHQFGLHLAVAPAG